MCNCETVGKNQKRTTLNLRASSSTAHPPQHHHHPTAAASAQQQQSPPPPSSALPVSRKRPRRVQFAAAVVVGGEHEDRDVVSTSLTAVLPSQSSGGASQEQIDSTASSMSSSCYQYPFVASDLWLQQGEQKRQRLEAFQEIRLLRGDPEAELFRESYQTLYQICHLLSAAATADDDDAVLPRQLFLGAMGAQLLLPSTQESSEHATIRGLEDGLVPAVALVRRIERRQMIRTVLALQTMIVQQQQQVKTTTTPLSVADDSFTSNNNNAAEASALALAAVSRQWSAAHGMFAHTVAIGDAVAAQIIFGHYDKHQLPPKEEPRWNTASSSSTMPRA